MRCGHVVAQVLRQAHTVLALQEWHLPAPLPRHAEAQHATRRDREAAIRHRALAAAEASLRGAPVGGAQRDMEGGGYGRDRGRHVKAPADGREPDGELGR